MLISQPAHAWISGQLASSWGNGSIGLKPASRELQIAAEQHDIAWLDWEQAPTLNPDTGLPYAFNELETIEHLAIWKTAIGRAQVYGRLPALLISMHGTYLYRRYHDFDADSSDEAALAQSFLHVEETRQAELFSVVHRSSDISHSQVDHARELISLWDAMSLSLCMGFQGSRTFDGVPALKDKLSITIASLSDAEDHYTVKPWPFRASNVELGCEMRRLTGNYHDENAMRSAIHTAVASQLRVNLFPA